MYGTAYGAVAFMCEISKDSDAVATGTTYIFDRHGTVKIQSQSFNPHRLEVSESTVDVAVNYATWPEFGDYDGLVKVERQQNLWPSSRVNRIG